MKRINKTQKNNIDKHTLKLNINNEETIMAPPLDQNFKIGEIKPDLNKTQSKENTQEETIAELHKKEIVEITDKLDSSDIKNTRVNSSVILPELSQSNSKIINAELPFIKVNEESKDEEQKPQKRKPGRPAKQKPVYKTDIVMTGIIKEPPSPDDYIRMVYTFDPVFFKNIFSTFRAYEVSEVEIIFDNTTITFYGASDTFKLEIPINAALLSVYYCKSPVRIVVQNDILSKIFQAITKKESKDFPYKISFVLKEESKNDWLYIYIKEYLCNTEPEYKCSINAIHDDFVSTRIVDYQYPIEFEMTGNYLNNKVKDISSFSSVLNIKKSGDKPLYLEFTDSADQKLTYSCYYEDPTKINLVSRIESTECFAAEILIDRIKKFVKNLVGDKVHLSCAILDPCLLTTNLIKIHNSYLAQAKLQVSRDSGKDTEKKHK